MPDQDSPTPQRDLAEDDLVARLVSDPAALPDVRARAGFLGRSARARHWRLYLTPELNDYLEFTKADVLHVRPLKGRDHPLGGSAVWFRREANLVHTRATSREAQADFLQGGIVAGHLPPSCASPLATHAIMRAPWLRAAGCLTGGQFDTLCVACTAEPMAFVAPSPR
jgi:hypothetical protein